MSKFWLRKMRTHFKTFDFDKDGYITEDEFVAMARSFAAKTNADPQSTEQLVQSFTKVWFKFMKSADPGKDSRLTPLIWIESVKQQRYDPDFMVTFVAMIQGLFHLLDVNKDGFLQPEEHKALFDYVGIPEETFDRRVGFDALDINHDGVISMNEFISGVFDFMFSEDEGSPRKYFFGPLVD